MLRESLTTLFVHAAESLALSGKLPAGLSAPEIAEPKQPDHGDFACNFALVAAKSAGMPPRNLAQHLVDAVQNLADHPVAKVGDAYLVQSLEIAGPGFINIRVSPEAHAAVLQLVLEKGRRFAFQISQNPQRINVEFVSVNPNGPITIGSGRGAAYGSTLANVLSAFGHTVHREYYINDGINSEQMRLFAESVRHWCAQKLASEISNAPELFPFPEKGYQGDYVEALAGAIISDSAGKTEPLALLEKSVTEWQALSQNYMLLAQREALSAFGVEFDTWFSEQSLHDQGLVQKEIDALIAHGLADENAHRTVLKLAKGGVIESVEKQVQSGDDEDTGTATGETVSPTLWLRSTKFDDDMDRVLRRRDGRLTYISSDVAYHKDKFSRPANATNLITILGPDHHGYIGRLTAVVAAMLLADDAVEIIGKQTPMNEIESALYDNIDDRDRCQSALKLAKEKLEVVIYQLVRFLKDGKPAPMRKRDGNIYALIDLVNEIGKAAAPNGDLTEQQRIGRDVARFFYLMRSHDTTMDFDLDLAQKQSDDNPVYYVQYAHARICSVIQKGAESNLKSSRENLKLLTHTRELELIRQICELSNVLRRCAEDYGVHRLATYAMELARSYHHFYDACRVVDDDNRELSEARLSLCEAARTALQAVLVDLLGISAPERMESRAND